MERTDETFGPQHGRRNTKGVTHMEKFIPYEKLSKKEKRKLDAKRRGSWGEISPVTRKPENPKAYRRQQARKWTRDVDSGPAVFSH